MAVSTTIPLNWYVPLFWAVTDGSLAGTLTQSQPALLVGHKLSAGVAVANVPIPIGSLAIAKQQFGEGSMLERMVSTFLKGNPNQQLWCVPVPEPSSGTAAAGSVAFSVASLLPGVLSLYIAGQVVIVTVYSTDSAATIATNVAAAINAVATLPVTAAVDGSITSKVNVTCRWKGLIGNDIDMRVNYRGFFGGEVLPVGLTPTITAMSGGLGNPDFTNAVAAIQAKTFTHVGMPFTDSASESTWATEYGFGPGGRWSYARAQYGWIYQAIRGLYADSLTWGLAQNSPVISTMAVEVNAPSPVWEWTAGYCAQGSAALLDDPARPLQTLEMPGLLVASVDQRFSTAQNNNLTNSGLAIQGTAPSGNAMILREALQYQRNQYGQADTAFALITVLSNIAEILSRMRSAITSKYPRHKLAPDGTRFGPGQAIVTPIMLKAELVAELRQLEYDGLTAQVDQAKKALVVEIDPGNPNRVNVLHPPRLMGQLRTFAVLEQFRLQFPTISLT